MRIVAICSICSENLCDCLTAAITIPPENGAGESPENGIEGAGSSKEDIPENFPVTTACGHVYHNVCIRKWFDLENKICPDCTSNIVVNDETGLPTLTRLFLHTEEDKDGDEGQYEGISSQIVVTEEVENIQTKPSTSEPDPDETCVNEEAAQAWQLVYKLEEERKEEKEEMEDLRKVLDSLENENLALKKTIASVQSAVVDEYPD